MKHFEEIIICPVCGGACLTRTANECEQHERDTEPCTKCKGTGRMVQITEVRLEPVTPAWEKKLARLPRDF